MIHPKRNSIEKPMSSKRSYVTLTKQQWNEILELYGSGGTTAKELSEQYGVSASAISKKAADAGIKRYTRIAPITPASGANPSTGAGLAHARFKTPQAKLFKPMNTDELRDAITNAKQSTLASADALATILNSAIGSMVQPTTPNEVVQTARTADMLGAALSRVWKIRREVLGVDRENRDADAVLPDLPIMEMTELQVKALRRRQRQDDGVQGLNTPDSDDDDALEGEAEPEIECVEEGFGA